MGLRWTKWSPSWGLRWKLLLVGLFEGEGLLLVGAIEGIERIFKSHKEMSSRLLGYMSEQRKGRVKAE